MKAALLICYFIMTVLLPGRLAAQDSLAKPKGKAWYEMISIRGYAQVRYNRLLETNPDLTCEQCDKSLGKSGGLFIRRARIIFSGQLNNHVYFYIQPDFASSPSSSALNFAQLRDAYLDVSVDKKREYRFRIGQSKVPFGFENMQSSQNRIPMDRSDALNSGLANERDLGVFFYYAPAKIRARFAHLVNDGLKGSGDYGVFGLGLYNGQTANKAENNDGQHVVARLSYPFQVGRQIIEPGLQAYKGIYTLYSSQLTDEHLARPDLSYTDERMAASLVLYPQPFGIQAEYNVGRGPEYNPKTGQVEVQRLYGGYVLLSYLKKVRNQTVIPFVRLQHFKGGKKHELDARAYLVREAEAGIEWQPSPYLEISAAYMAATRQTSDHVDLYNRQTGNRLRLQVQLNFP